MPRDMRNVLALQENGVQKRFIVHSFSLPAASCFVQCSLPKGLLVGYDLRKWGLNTSKSTLKCTVDTVTD